MNGCNDEAVAIWEMINMNGTRPILVFQKYKVTQFPVVQNIIFPIRKYQNIATSGIIRFSNKST